MEVPKKSENYCANGVDQKGRRRDCRKIRAAIAARLSIIFYTETVVPGAPALIIALGGGAKPEKTIRVGKKENVGGLLYPSNLTEEAVE